MNERAGTDRSHTPASDTRAVGRASKRLALVLCCGGDWDAACAESCMNGWLLAAALAETVRAAAAGVHVAVAVVLERRLPDLHQHNVEKN